MPKHLIASALLLAALPATAHADTPSQDIAGWTVSPSRDGTGCFLTKTFDRPGDTTVMLGLDTDGTNHLSVLNANWSIRPRDALKLDFALSGGNYAKHAAVGLVSDGKPGFVTSFELKFPRYFAASRFLRIARGDTPVERLDLDGSGAAVDALRHCAAVQRARPKSAAKRPDGIPVDPFASTSPRKPRK